MWSVPALPVLHELWFKSDITGPNKRVNANCPNHIYNSTQWSAPPSFSSSLQLTYAQPLRTTQHSTAQHSTAQHSTAESKSHWPPHLLRANCYTPQLLQNLKVLVTAPCPYFVQDHAFRGFSLLKCVVCEFVCVWVRFRVRLCLRVNHKKNWTLLTNGIHT